jgi:starvation-inducible DNA-binding protein
MTMPSKYTIPGLDAADAEKVAHTLQQRLTALLDLQLTLKHVHWNVIGPNFISVHEMLDPQVDAVRLMSDKIAERIATLGYEPMGTPGFVTANRSWDDYSLNRAVALEHLAALDVVYSGVVEDHRAAVEQFEEQDPVSQDMLIGQLHSLETFQWFIRAHLEDRGGALAHGDAATEQGAADAVGGSTA